MGTRRHEPSRQSIRNVDANIPHVDMEDNTTLNGEFLHRGYEIAHTRFPFSYVAEFRHPKRKDQAGGIKD